MNANDWGTPSTDWQPARSTPTFKQDLGGFLFHLSMLLLIGGTAAYAWQAFMPQPVIQIQVQEGGK